MEIIRALPSDAETLTQIAFAAKRHWNYPEQWIEQWRTELTITAPYIETHEVYAARVEGELVGFYSLAGDADKIELDNLWVLPRTMGQGIGRALFAHAVERARARGAPQLVIESDPNAEGFYRRMGAQRIGEKIRVTEGQRREIPVLIFDLHTASESKHEDEQNARS